ncbi:putative metal-dependent hydrolase YabD [Cocos nucifera]|uniref:Putative metal-dependent hydrolase YabD n=1 Tax=Cocos nucifera TaxID=13894 RepID=A0A8K0N8Y3_COCNU|nr:putative metal-dependent hydrolase YabD [Cocos nucifera]
MSGVGQARAVRLFDAHCHLQDPRIATVAPRLIRAALDSGVLRFAVNGVSEKDWHIVKQMSDEYPCIIPCFGLHPWYVAERSPDWLRLLKDFFASTPAAAVGEIGIDKGSHGKNIDFTEQVEVFRQQLELAKELRKPVSVHCVQAFGDLLEILQQTGPFPAGVVLHSYLGSAEMVSGLAKLGSYFSCSGHLTSMNTRKAKKMLKSVPLDRILIESDAPDGLSKWKTDSLLLVPEDDSTSQEQQNQYENSSVEATTLSKEALNHPANISNVLNYVAMLLEMPEEELAELSYQNATRLFSYPGSKV